MAPVLIKSTRICDECHEKRPSRYRAIFDQFLCSVCYQIRTQDAERGQAAEHPDENDEVIVEF
jgi:hypothetical protein